jgi:hypothetical protein
MDIKSTFEKQKNSNSTIIASVIALAIILVPIIWLGVTCGTCANDIVVESAHKTGK